MPPSYMLPYIGTAYGQAANLLQVGGPGYYPGRQTAQFNPVQEQAFGNIQKLARSNPYQAATQYNNALLKGNFGGPASQLEAMGQGGAMNPHLDEMFQQAAGTTRNQLSSEFANAGRNLGAAAPLRSEQLNNLATSLYGGAYAQDQANALAANQALSGLQQQAVGNAQNLVNSKLGLQNAAAQVGQRVQDQSQKLIDASMNAYNYDQNQPYKNLQWFESMLGGLQPGSQTQNPITGNPGADALGNLLAMQKLYQGFSSKGGSGGDSDSGFSMSGGFGSTGSPLTTPGSFDIGGDSG
ncbi:MAG TPA: hypothetical protein VF651_08410 [Gammaproteobacteria bacterium]